MEHSQDTEENWESALCDRLEHMENGDSLIKPMEKNDYIIAGVIVAFCLCAVVFGALIGGNQVNGKQQSVSGITEYEKTTDTGAWRKGTIYHGDYQVDFQCPEVGHPGNGADWETHYYYESADMDVGVEFYIKDAAIEDIKNELEQELVQVKNGELWGHKVSYFLTYDEFNAVMEEGISMQAEKITVLLPLASEGKDEALLQIEIKSVSEPLLNAEELMKDPAFRQAFMVVISDREDL